jgi:hypothetical protein
VRKEGRNLAAARRGGSGIVVVGLWSAKVLKNIRRRTWDGGGGGDGPEVIIGARAVQTSVW